MKVNGRRLEPPKPLDVIFPRHDQPDVHFRMQAVPDESPFTKAHPEPEPPMIGKPGEAMKPNHKDSGYKQQLAQWNDRHLGWLMLSALKPTQGLEFENASLDDPASWSWKALYAEMLTSGLNDHEVSVLLKKLRQVNSVDEEAMEEARKRFLQSAAGQGQNE